MMNEKLNKIFNLLFEHKLTIISEINEDFKCVICKELLVNPRQSLYGCHFCQSCINNYKDSGSKNCPGNTDECKFEDLSTISIDYKINKRISNLIVRCPYKMCSHECQLIEIEDHMKFCSTRNLNCPYKNVGCEHDKMNTDKLNEHMLLEIVNHNKMLIDIIANLRNEVHELKEKEQRNQKEIEILKENEKLFVKEIKLIKKEKEDLSEQMEICDRNLWNSIDKIDIEMKNKCTNDDIKSINYEMKLLKMEKEELSYEMNIWKSDFDDKFNIELNARLNEIRKVEELYAIISFFLFGLFYVSQISLFNCICFGIISIGFIALIRKYNLIICLKTCWIVKFIVENFKYLHDRPDYSTMLKPSVLKNSTDTCYMNSLIQMLASSDKMIRQLKFIKNNISKPNPGLNRLIDLLHGINDPFSSCAENTNKLAYLINYVKWVKVSQQDVYDLLSSIINCINTETEPNLLKTEKQRDLKIKFVYKFRGIDNQNKFQSHLGLSLGLCGNYTVYPGVKLEYLIDKYFSPTIIDEDYTKTYQIYFYQESPEILLFHIQANKWDQNLNKMVKPNYYIQYEENIELNLTIAQNLDSAIKHEKVKYKLCAIIHHDGNISGGHYVTYRKFYGNWFLVDDEKVKKYDFQCDICPYILIYEKDNSFCHRFPTS